MEKIIDNILKSEMEKWIKAPAKELAQHFYGGHKYKIEKDGYKFKLFFVIFISKIESNKDEIELVLSCGEDDLFKLSYYIPRGTSLIIKKPENFDKEFEIFKSKN